MQRDPTKRYDVKAIKHHCWIVTHTEGVSKDNGDVSKSSKSSDSSKENKTIQPNQSSHSDSCTASRLPRDVTNTAASSTITLPVKPADVATPSTVSESSHHTNVSQHNETGTTSADVTLTADGCVGGAVDKGLQVEMVVLVDKSTST